MASGQPLTDEDRAPWLKLFEPAVAQVGYGGNQRSSGLLRVEGGLSRGAGGWTAPGSSMRLVFLDASREMLAERLKARSHEFMNPALLESQLTTLEAPANAFKVVNDRRPQEIVDIILEYIWFGA